MADKILRKKNPCTSVGDTAKVKKSREIPASLCFDVLLHQVAHIEATTWLWVSIVRVNVTFLTQGIVVLMN
jgi:hypothetical protein